MRSPGLSPGTPPWNRSAIRSPFAATAPCAALTGPSAAGGGQAGQIDRAVTVGAGCAGQDAAGEPLGGLDRAGVLVRDEPGAAVDGLGVPAGEVRRLRWVEEPDLELGPS